jgi:hypothetical protein
MIANLIDAPQNKAAITEHLKAFLASFEMFEKHNGRPIKSGMPDYYNLILNKGEWFVGRKLAKEYEYTKAFKRSWRPKIKQCFYNSQMFVTFSEDVGARYFEGYMCDSFFVVHHGWVVLADGNVIDFTLEARDALYKREKTKIPEKTEPVAYLGVEVPVEFLKKKIAETKLCQPYAQCYHLNVNQYFMD